MVLKCIGSGSDGNSYALIDSNGKILLLDLGLPKNKIVKAIDYRVSDIVGALLTHQHSDHSESVKDFLNCGIPIYTNKETAEFFKDFITTEMISVPEMKPFQCENFTITPFYLPHTKRDKETKQLIPCPNFGYLIKHDEMGKMLYLTDLEYCKFNFHSLEINHILIECNYQKELIQKDGFIYDQYYEHKLRGHMSLDCCKSFIQANKTNALRNIILCHLGAETTIAEECVAEVQKAANCPVYVAEKGMEIELSLYPF